VQGGAEGCPGSCKNLLQGLTSCNNWCRFFFLLAPSGYHGKKRAGDFAGSAFALQNDLHSMHALLLEISGMYAASHP